MRDCTSGPRGTVTHFPTVIATWQDVLTGAALRYHALTWGKMRDSPPWAMTVHLLLDILPHMPRSARIVIPGIPHHITHRGNNRQEIFFTAGDRQLYLKLLAELCQQHGLEIMGYCLMTNHIHLVGIPRAEASLALAVGRAHFQFTLYFNKRYHRSGHLWQNRFYSCPMDDEHTSTALSYLERNPVRAGLCESAWAYPWSSALAHIGEGDATGMLDLAKWCERIAFSDWQTILSAPEDDALLGRIRDATYLGRPLGSQAFVKQFEERLGRSVQPRGIGRPSKYRHRDR